MNLLQRRIYYSLILACLLCVTIPVFILKNQETTVEPEVRFRPFKDIFIPVNEALFFIESDVMARDINPISQCALESAALTNPSKLIIYVVDSSSMIQDKSIPFHLKLIPNIVFARDSFEQMNRGMPSENFIKKFANDSVYPTQNISNIWRILVLLKYGGTYCDLDHIFMQSLENLENNYIVSNINNPGSGHHFSVNGAFMNFEKDHSYLWENLYMLNETFKDGEWGSCGPRLNTRALLKMCNKASVRKLDWTCKGITIKPDYFSNILINHDNCGNQRRQQRCVVMLYSSEEEHFDYINALITPQTVAMHTHTSVIRFTSDASRGIVRENQVMYRLMQSYCPRTQQKTLKKRIGKSYLNFMDPLTKKETGRKLWTKDV